MVTREQLQAAIAANPFSATPVDEATFSVKYLTDSLFAMNLDAEREFAQSGDINKAFSHMIPEFQRSNDKWTPERQTCFVENTLAGLRPTITLYFIKGDVPAGRLPTHLYCLDGQQRTTSLIKFVSNELSLFGGMHFNDIKKLISRSLVQYQVFAFDSHKDACRFYIDINRGITHSEADILKAEKFLTEA